MTVGKLSFNVYDPIFKQKVLVMLNCTEEDFRKFEKKEGIVNPVEFDTLFGGWTTHISSSDKPTTYIIFIPSFDWTINDQATLIHEIIHVVFRIWGSNNISVIPETQEFLAHSVDGLFTEISSKLYDKSKPNTKKKK